MFDQRRMMNTDPLTRVAIHGVPRSGTSWIGEIFNSSPNTVYRFQPLFSYAHKNFLGETSSLGDIKEFFTRLHNCSDAFTTQVDRRKAGQFPTFEKGSITHIVYKETQSHNILINLMRRAEWLKLCAVIRNPISVICSWFGAPKDFRADLKWSMEEEWRYAPKKNQNKPEHYYGYEKWKEACKIFTYLHEQYPDRVYIINYSHLLESTQEETQSMFSFCALEMTDATVHFIEASSKKTEPDPYSVFRANQTDAKWVSQDSMKEIADAIRKDLQGTDFERYL